MKRVYQSISVLLALLLALSCLAACGGDDAQDPNLGKYLLSEFDGMPVAEYAELMDMSYEEARNSITVTLLAGGKAEMTSDGEVTKGTWKLDGEKFSLGEEGAAYEGTLKDGVMTLRIGAAEFTFTRDGKDAPANGGATEDTAATEGTEATEDTGALSAYDWWDGDWYGWWVVYEAEGAFADYEDLFLDAFAEIRVDGSVGTVKLWHCFGDRACRIAEAEIEFVDGEGENGYFYTSGGALFPDGLMSVGGDAVTPMDLVYYDWVVDPADSSVSHFEDMIEIKGYYTDPENEENKFTYYAYLRPWGETWEDVRTGDTTDCIYDDMMPYYYDDWYLPLLELGYTSSIVDFDEGKSFIENGIRADGSVVSDDPTEPPAPAALDPAGRFDGTGEVDMDTLTRGLEWCKEKTGYKTTYDEVAAQFGVHGRRELSEYYDDMVYYIWSCGDAYVKVGFTINADGSETWNVTQYDGF
ncbi:MAG: hypothetical protein IJJ99_08190 [Oscillospiraceae bacterium]|nr:hypothetical protein [Oscillospiraceae bacterium]